MAESLTVTELLDGHVALDVECLDRIRLNGYVPNLQVGGQVASFMTQHLGYPIPSPAILEKTGTAFRRSVRSFAEADQIPVVRFRRGDRKIDVMGRCVAARAATGRSGVAAIGVAQQYQNVFAATQRERSGGFPWFSFTKADRRVTCFYLYLWDVDFGPAFIKICVYFPYPIKVLKVWVNGHEWAKRQAIAAGIEWTALSNGFATCQDPAALQRTCDQLGPKEIETFFQRWMTVLPLPLTEHDRVAGYWWELSMRQVEVSRTMVFNAPPQRRPGTSDRDRRELMSTPADLRCLRRLRRLQHLDELQAKAVMSTPGCSILNASGRVVSLRAQPLSGSRSSRSPRTGGGPKSYGSATLGPWPCSAPCVSPWAPSGSPTGASVPG